MKLLYRFTTEFYHPDNLQLQCGKLNNLTDGVSVKRVDYLSLQNFDIQVTKENNYWVTCDLMRRKWFETQEEAKRYALYELIKMSNAQIEKLNKDLQITQHIKSLSEKYLQELENERS